MARPRPRRLWLLAPAAVVVVLLGVVAVMAVPILTHRDQGVAEQVQAVEEWSSSATAEGDDGRTRTIAAADESGAPIDASALAEGQRIVVTGEGFDPERGIYVAISPVSSSCFRRRRSRRAWIAGSRWNTLATSLPITPAGGS